MWLGSGRIRLLKLCECSSHMLRNEGMSKSRIRARQITSYVPGALRCALADYLLPIPKSRHGLASSKPRKRSYNLTRCSHDSKYLL